MNAQAEKTLLEKLKSLPPARLAEVEDFVDFLKAREERTRDEASHRSRVTPTMISCSPPRLLRRHRSSSPAIATYSCSVRSAISAFSLPPTRSRRSVAERSQRIPFSRSLGPASRR